jgi:hypothetical protein
MATHLVLDTLGSASSLVAYADGRQAEILYPV